jgi:hypothetical protein
MYCLPREIQTTIVHLIPDSNDRDSLVDAFLTWADIVDHKDSLGTIMVDHAGEHRYALELDEVLEEFENLKARRRQYL